MAYAPEWFPFILYVCTFAAALLAATVIWMGPLRISHWYLALMLAGEGTLYVLTVIYSEAWFNYSDLVAPALASLYLSFLGQTLPVGPARLFRPIGMQISVWIPSGICIWMMVSGLRAGDFTTVNTGAILGKAFLFIAVTIGIVASLVNVLAAPKGTAQKRRARAFLAAFLVRDLAYIWTFIHGAVYTLLLVAAGRSLKSVTDPFLSWGMLVFGLQALLFLAFLSYAVFRAEIIDLDRKLRWTVEKGAIAAPFPLVFVFVAEGLESLLPFSSWWLAIPAAATLGLAFRPLERMAKRFAARVVPSGSPLAELDEVQKESLFRDQVKIAWEDGKLGGKEQRMLERWRVQLGLDEKTASRLAKQVAPKGAMAAARSVGTATGQKPA